MVAKSCNFYFGEGRIGSSIDCHKLQYWLGQGFFRVLKVLKINYYAVSIFSSYVEGQFCCRIIGLIGWPGGFAGQL